MIQARTVSFVAVSYLVQTFGSIIFYLIAAKALPVQEVGAITLFLSFGAIFIVAFSLNLDTGFTHFISYSFGKTGKYSLPTLFLEIAALMMAVSFVAIAASSHLIALIFFHSLTYSSVVILMGGYVSLSTGLGYMVSILQGKQSFRLASLSNMMYSVLSMGIPIGMILFKFPVEVVSSGFVIGAGVTFILSVVFVAVEKIPRTSVEMGFLTRFFAYVTPVYFGALTSSLMSTVDRVILPALTNLTLSAVYTYSLTISTVVTAVSFPFSFFLLPKISQAFASSDQSAERVYSKASLELFYYLALPASIGGTLLAKPLLDVLVGGIYASHFIILQIMIFSYSFFSFRPILSTILLGNRRTGVYLYSGISALGANVFLSLALIPPFGIYGAVVASVSAWAVSTIPRMVAISRLLNHSLPLAPYTRMWINTIIMAAAVFYCEKFFTSGYESLFIPVLVGILSYFILSRVNIPLSVETREIVSSLARDSHPLIGRLLEFFAVTRKV